MRPHTLNEPQSASARITRRRGTVLAAESWGGVALSLVAAGSVGAVLAYFEPSNSGVLLVGLGLVLLGPLAFKLVVGSFDPFEPLFLFALTYGAMFVVRPAAVLITDDFSYPIGVADVNFSSGFEPMLLIALLGAVGFTAGYLAPLGRGLARSIRAPLRSYHPEIAGLTTGAFAVLGIAFFVLFLAFAGGFEALGLYLSGRSFQLTQLLSETNKYLVVGPIILLPAAVILLALGTTHRSSTMLLAGLVSATSLVLIAAPTGRRSWLFPLILSIAIYFFMTRNRRPSLKAVLAGLLILLALSALVGTVRSADVRRTIGVSEAATRIAHKPVRIFEPLTTGTDASLATGLAAVLSMPPDRIAAAYPGQAVVGDLVTRGVPRGLWSAKPEPPRQKAARALFGRKADVFFANPEFSVVLYPYLDGGLVGVLLFMALYGCLTRAMFEYAMLHRSSILARLGFALLVPVLIAGVRDSPVDTLARFAFVMAPLVLAFGLGHLAMKPLGRAP